jgi:prevent-host-death family protein
MAHDSTVVTVDDAVQRFADLLLRVEAGGEEIEVVRDGTVVARIVPAEKKRATLGGYRKAWAQRERLSPEEADLWLKELEELRALTPLPNPAWD